MSIPPEMPDLEDARRRHGMHPLRSKEVALRSVLA
jgi:hypothetical protein